MSQAVPADLPSFTECMEEHLSEELYNSNIVDLQTSKEHQFIRPIDHIADWEKHNIYNVFVHLNHLAITMLTAKYNWELEALSQYVHHPLRLSNVDLLWRLLWKQNIEDQAKEENTT